MLKITRLPKGLTVITQRQNHFHMISGGIWFRVGSRYETFQQQGASHFVEHMVFKRTHNRMAKDISLDIEKVGASLNAYTDREKTGFYFQTLKEGLSTCLDVVGDFLSHSIFHDEDFQKERDVIYQEILQYQETPDDRVFDVFYQNFYRDHSLGRSILGTMDSLSNLTPQDLKNYMGRHYRCNHGVVCAVGDVDHDAFVDLVQKHFDLASGSHESILERPRDYQSFHILEKRPSEQVHLILGGAGVSYKDEHRYALGLLTAILGSGMSSRLFQEVRENRGLAYSIYSFSSLYRDTGLWGVYAGVAAMKKQEAVDVIQEELHKMLHKGCTLQELQCVQIQMRAAVLSGLESSMSQCERLASNWLAYDSIEDIGEFLKAIESVTLEDLDRIAQTMLSDISVCCIEPDKEGFSELSC